MSDPTRKNMCSDHRTRVTVTAVPGRQVLLSRILERSLSILNVGHGRDSVAAHMNGSAA